MGMNELLDLPQTRDEVPGELGIRRLADHDQKSDAMTDHRVEFVHLVPDSLIVTDGDSAVAAAIFKPLFVPAVRWEEIAVREEDEPHAARS